MAKIRKNTSVSLKPLTFEEVIRELAKLRKHDLEDYSPGASRMAVFSDLNKTAVKVRSRKRVSPPASTS